MPASRLNTFLWLTCLIAAICLGIVSGVATLLPGPITRLLGVGGCIACIGGLSVLMIGAGYLLYYNVRRTE